MSAWLNSKVAIAIMIILLISLTLTVSFTFKRVKNKVQTKGDSSPIGEASDQSEINQNVGSIDKSSVEINNE